MLKFYMNSINKNNTLNLRVLAIYLLLLPFTTVEGHAFMGSPKTRNYLAYLGRDQYTPHGLNSGPTGGCGGDFANGGGRHSKGIVSGTYPDSSSWDPQIITVDNIYTAGQVIDVEIKMNAYHAGFFQFWLYTNPGSYQGADIDLEQKPSLRSVQTHCVDDGVVPDGIPSTSVCCYYPVTSSVPSSPSGACPGGLTRAEFVASGGDDAAYYSLWWLPGRPGQENTAAPYGGSTAPWPTGDGFGHYKVPIRIPDEACNGTDAKGGHRCVLQWWWMTNNSCIGWTIPDTGRVVKNPTIESNMQYCKATHDRMGAGPEQFWNCADINIVQSTEAGESASSEADEPDAHSPSPTPSTTPSPTSAPTRWSPPKGPVFSNFTCLRGYVAKGKKLDGAWRVSTNSVTLCQKKCAEDNKCAAVQFTKDRADQNCELRQKKKRQLRFRSGAYEKHITSCWRTTL